jgi:hypothetical protein
MKIARGGASWRVLSINIVRIIIPRRIRWAVHVARMGTGEVHTEVWWRKLRETDHFQDLGVGGNIIVKWILREWDGVGHGLD